jgi:hypothetical protein
MEEHQLNIADITGHDPDPGPSSPYLHSLLPEVHSDVILACPCFLNPVQNHQLCDVGIQQLITVQKFAKAFYYSSKAKKNRRPVFYGFHIPLNVILLLFSSASSLLINDLWMKYWMLQVSN